MAWRVLVTARAFWDNGQKAQAELEEAGCFVGRSPNPGPVPEDELIELLQEYDAIVGSSDPYTERLLQSCPRLKVVSRCGVGVDSVNVPAATRAGVIVTNTPGAMTDAVSDLAFAMLLAIARRVVESDVLMHSGGWGEFPGTLVWGKTLGLIGVGQIGRGVAVRAQGFNMRVLAYDPPAEKRGADPLVTFVGLNELLEQSDFVSVHAPANAETKGMIGAAQLERMQPGAFLINTARGSLIDEPALIDALERGRIAGAALDVHCHEPLPADDPLRKAPHCLLSPHNGFNAVEAARRMSEASAHNIALAVKGQRPEWTVNPDVWSSPALRVPELR
jgi:D-3-phosphoglycerate dehydrogenase